MTLSPPQPSVLHLLTLFRQISAGEIRIPAFQRSFIWKERQIIELLESVKSGYPIGSLLLWNSNSPKLVIASSSASTFPDVPEIYPVNYVLDGMQRLSSLYGVFHFGTSTEDPQFNIWFDLESERFVNSTDFDLFAGQHVVPLAALFSPRALLQYQQKLSASNDADVLIERLLQLQSAFQEYMVPVVQIRGEDLDKIVSIFEKINSTGTSLGKVDFMRAITWAQDFDLSSYLETTESWLELDGFAFSDETIVKCVALILGVQPSSDALLSLRSKTSEELDGAFSKFRLCASRVIDFLKNDLHIISSDFVPYEGQFLVLFKTVGMEAQLNEKERSAICSWFWATSFNESLRGKADHYSVRAVDNWRDLIRGKIRGLEPRLKITDADFFERRLIKGKALSTAYMAMYRQANARDIFSGEVIDSRLYMKNSGVDLFVPILDEADLGRINRGKEISLKFFANLLLVPDAQRLHSPFFSIRDALSVDSNAESLGSQFIDGIAYDFLRKKDFENFLSARASLMKAAAASMAELHVGQSPNFSF